MRRWTGTRWISYDRDARQPDEPPLLDFEDEAKARSELSVAPPTPLVQFGCEVDGQVVVSHVTVAGVTTVHVIPPVPE